MAYDIFWMNVAAVFAFVNLAMVLGLIALYYQSWRRIPSSLTLGLIVFAGFFLIQNLVIVVFWYILYSLVASAQGIVVGAAPYLTVINATESFALANLVRITLK
ncbi:MAG: hypothetical protein OK455_00315 [Thaumarchaeota archaeon]|nr:hypothetical protein [Nitrososphaerota archaeon]